MTQRHERRTRRGPNKDHAKRKDGRSRNRRELGQNFLKERRTARRIVAASGVGAGDLVVEFGAGGGMLTRQLAKVSRRVMAVEYDPYWATRLEDRFSGDENVCVIQDDALKTKLPDEPFVVVANLPFGATTPILHRLLDDPESPLRAAHLVVQKQVALKHARSSPTTLKSLHWSPWYEFTADLELPAEAFRPRPKVDACLMVAAKRGPPLVDPGHRHLFRAFARRAFIGPGKIVGKTLRPFFTRTQLRRLARDNAFSLDAPPSALAVHQWAGVFRFMVFSVPKHRWTAPRWHEVAG